MIEAKYNNKLEYVKFLKNDDGKSAMVIPMKKLMLKVVNSNSIETETPKQHPDIEV